MKPNYNTWGRVTIKGVDFSTAVHFDPQNRTYASFKLPVADAERFQGLIKELEEESTPVLFQACAYTTDSPIKQGGKTVMFFLEVSLEETIPSSDTWTFKCKVHDVNKATKKA